MLIVESCFLACFWQVVLGINLQVERYNLQQSGTRSYKYMQYF